MKYQATAQLCIQNEKKVAKSAYSSPISGNFSSNYFSPKEQSSSTNVIIFDEIPSAVSSSPAKATPTSEETAVLTFQQKKHLWGPSDMFRPASIPNQFRSHLNIVDDDAPLSPLSCRAIFTQLPASTHQSGSFDGPAVKAARSEISSSGSTGSWDAEDQLSFLSGHSTPTQDSWNDPQKKSKFCDDSIELSPTKSKPKAQKTASVLWPSPSSRHLAADSSPAQRSASAGSDGFRMHPQILRRHSSDDCWVEHAPTPRSSNGAIVMDSRAGSMPRASTRRHVSICKLNTWLSDAPSTLTNSETTTFIRLEQSRRGVRVESQMQVDVFKEDRVLMA